MFKVWQYNRQFNRPASFCIVRNLGNHSRDYLHSDGSVYGTREYWPTRELAQAVLDKYQPKHVWEHGDVFENGDGDMVIYLESVGGIIVQYLTKAKWLCTPAIQLNHAKFLFNIKDKL